MANLKYINQIWSKKNLNDKYFCDLIFDILTIYRHICKFIKTEILTATNINNNTNWAHN